ncbi:C2 family cysteine protease [Ottowia massiliensis]|jgi:hypothetical protein|uniref:C2 family cysteine protease n=1 Tax=Ottowia massiliensis TaxID=2045302 RepID=UPI000C858A88|nr:C2 family cysteine protease [Ottowia massiliensis]
MAVSVNLSGISAAMFAQKDAASRINPIIGDCAKLPPDFCPMRRQFDDKNLYNGKLFSPGSEGTPRAVDIQQDSIGDCYFLSAIGSIAEKNPQAIKDSISYDPATKSFTVRMYKKELVGFHVETKEVYINVTQAELNYNLSRKGGSTIDNSVCKNGAAWPMVLETAYAKMNDSNPADGLKEGFDKIGEGGWPGDAMFTVTGKESHTVSFSSGFGSILDGYPKLQQEAVYQKVSGALAEGKPVTLSVHGESLLDQIMGKKDNLADNHAYMVTGIRKDANGEIMVTVRNPWANNNDGEGIDSSNAEIEVKLSDLHASGTTSSLPGEHWGFEIGG